MGRAIAIVEPLYSLKKKKKSQEKAFEVVIEFYFFQ